MRTGKVFSMAFENLKQRRLRTSLTTLGVVIGITTIIGLASLGEGFRIEVRQRLESGFELDVLIVFPGSVTAGLGEPFTADEVNRIKAVPNVTLVTPLITLPSAELFKTDSQGNKTKIGAFTVGAVNFTEMQEMLPNRFNLSVGVFPSLDENDTVVFGSKTVTLNETQIVNLGDNVTFLMNITVNSTRFTINKNFTVTGILQEGGTPGVTNFDYWAFIPTETAASMIGERYSFILVKVADPNVAEQVSKDVAMTFDNPYRISVLVPTSFVRLVDNILNLLQIFLLAIASISLLVAGIGIMNIMTVSVMERTREIGILKAIGAKSQTVLSMFLAEAAIIGIIGGVIGLFTGYGLSYALAFMLSSFAGTQQYTLFSTPGRQPLPISPVFTPEWTIAAFIFAVTVCLIFGIYPARKAAKLNPVEALRYE